MVTLHGLELLILRHVLRPRRICYNYDFFAPFINLLTYILTEAYCSMLYQ